MKTSSSPRRCYAPSLFRRTVQAIALVPTLDIPCCSSCPNGGGNSSSLRRVGLFLD